MARKEEAYKLASKRLIENILQDNEERASKNIEEPIDPSSARGQVQRIVSSKMYVRVNMALVILNAVLLGIETDINRCEPDLVAAWPILETCFLTFFVVELLLRAFLERGAFGKHSWNVWDAGLVFFASCDILILEYSVPRVRRFLRLLLIIRVVRFVEELWFLAEGILLALRTLAWAWLLVLFSSYICAILLTRTLGQEHSQDDPALFDLFGSMTRSMYTLFAVMTNEGWAEISRRCMAHGSLWAVFFILFISVTTLALMNVVAAVVVQTTLEHASQRAAEAEASSDQKEQTALMKIVEVFKAADADCDGEVTRVEFNAALENPAVVHLLHDVGVDVRQAESLFDILDYNDSGSLDANEFVEGVLMARGEAKAKEVLAVQCDMWKAERKLGHCLDRLGQRISFTVREINGVVSSFQQDLEGVQKCAQSLFRAAKEEMDQ